MAQYTEGNIKSYLNGATAIGPALRVKVSSGVLAVAGIADREIGVTMTRIEANVNGPVRLRNATGTVRVTAAEQIATEAVVYTAANGMIADTAASTSFPFGTAQEAASGSGSIIEVATFGGYPTAN